jgi:hypothetical protein
MPGTNRTKKKMNDETPHYGLIINKDSSNNRFEGRQRECKFITDLNTNEFDVEVRNSNERDRKPPYVQLYRRLSKYIRLYGLFSRIISKIKYKRSKIISKIRLFGFD